MLKSLLLSTAAIVLAVSPVMAQVAVNNSTTNSNATSGSSSNSSSTSGATNAGNAQNITVNNPAVPTTTTSNFNDRVTGGTSNSSSYYGDQTIRSAPQVYAPPVSGGNPCTLAVSGGASFLGWGAAAGGTFVDTDCANRQKIAMIWNAGFKGAAKELMCNDRATYDAFKTAGEPCAVRSQYEPPGMAQQPAPPVVVTPVPQPMVQRQAPTTYPRCNPRAGIVDNCRS